MTSPKRSIAMLAACPFPTQQGTQVVIRHLATALAQAGHDVHVITYGYSDPQSDTQDLPFFVHRAAKLDAGLRSGPNFRKPAADAALLFTAVRVMKAHRCELIHAHNVEGLALGALLKLQTGVPLVYHAHNAMGPELPTYFRKQIAQVFASMVGEVVDRTLPLAADAVVVFDSDHKSLHAVYGVDEKRLHVIPPGIDPEELGHPAPDQVAAARQELGPGPWLLYSGNADGYQNLDLLWRAMVLLRERSAARLLILTHHETTVWDELLKPYGLQDRVVVRRPSSTQELATLMAVADVGLSPRILWTGAPIKILNYMAAGLPVVACSSSARHLVSHDAGILVGDTPEDFADGVLKMLEAPRRSPTAFAPFHIKKHVPAYEAVYDSIVKPPLAEITARA